MNASTRKCTDIRPCNLINCYGCRRRLIDETATAMLLVPGTTQEDVDRYRYAAINALAFEITPPAPKVAKAPKAFAPKAGRDYQATADKLRVCGSRQYAAELVKGYTVAELQQVWTLARRTDKILGKLKADKVSYVIESLVGYRLDTNAILNTK